MSGSPLKKFVVTPVVISAAVFGALTLPLAAFGKQPVTVQLQGEPVFYGQLRDAATPYLGLASAISLGAGMASVAVAGWRSSQSKSSQVEAELSTLAQHLKEKEAQLEALKLSESKLDASGLTAFVDESVSLEPAIETTSVSQEAKPVVEAQIISEHPVQAQVVVPSSLTVQSAAAKFASSQAFLGYVQTKPTPLPVKEIGSSEVEQLHNQLQQIMAQMVSVQAALESTRGAAKSKEIMPEKVQPQAVQSWSVHSLV